jgi:hypothetical protein
MSHLVYMKYYVTVFTLWNTVQAILTCNFTLTATFLVFVFYEADDFISISLT